MLRDIPCKPAHFGDGRMFAVAEELDRTRMTVWSDETVNFLRMNETFLEIAGDTF